MSAPVIASALTMSGCSWVPASGGRCTVITGKTACTESASASTAASWSDISAEKPVHSWL